MIKNIIIVNDFDYIQGGASKVAIDTANLLVNSSDEIKVYFFSASHGVSSNLDKKVVSICTNQGEALKSKNRIKGFINGIYNFKAKRELKKLLKSLNKDETIIHVHGWTKCLSSSVFDVAFKLNYKLVLTMHDYFTACPNGGYFNYKENKICKLNPLSFKCIKCNCDSRNYLFKMYRIIRQFVQNKIVKLNDKLTDVISISNFSEKILKQTLNPKIKIHRVYNPINFDNNIEKVDFSKNEYFLYVGRISKEKGVDIFCKAITETNMKGIVVGDGDEKEKLEKKYSNIKFVGWKNSLEVKEYMKKAKALIFPSRWYETAGLTVLEAQALGLFTIVNENTAASEFLFNDISGTKYIGFEDLKQKIMLVEKNNVSFKLNMDIYSYENYIYTLLKVYDKL